MCGGTLISNSWILTADRCVPPGTTASDLEVRYGADSDAPAQVSLAAEIVRFGSNDGSADHRSRDVVLLGSAQPFAVNGKTYGFAQPLAAYDESLEATQKCAGWDLSPDKSNPTNRLKLAVLDPVGATRDTTIGDQIWWLNTEPADPTSGVLPTITDTGCGCFINIAQIDMLTSIVTDVPTFTHDERVNAALESRSLGLTDIEFREWIQRALYSEPEHLQLNDMGPVAVSWSSSTTLELLGVSLETGSLMWRTQTNGAWGDAVDLGSPRIALSKALRPAGLWRKSGQIEVLAGDIAGDLWWKRRLDGWSNWQRVDTATTRVTSAVKMGEKLPGHFHIVARGANGELRHGEFDGSWLPEWRDLGVSLSGEPTIDVPQEDRVNVFFANGDGLHQIGLLSSKEWRGGKIADAIALASAPAVASAGLNWFDLVVRSPEGQLRKVAYRAGWEKWVDSGLQMPAGDPVLAVRGPGELDVFVSEGGAGIWHVAWPRTPHSGISN